MKCSRSKNVIRYAITKALFPALAVSFSLTAHAEGLEPEYTIAYNVGVVSDYRVRGIAQTNYKPALQGGIDFTHKSGVYLGTAASNVNWVKDFNGATKGSLEVDLYGGYRGQLADNLLSYDVGIIRYQYPGNNSGAAGFYPAGTFSNASTTEAYGVLTFNIVTFKYNRSLGNFLGNLNSSGSEYFDLSAAFALPNSFTLTPHIGHQDIPNQTVPGASPNYSDYSLTLSKDFGNGLSATVAGIKTNADRTFYTDTKGRYLARSTVTVGVKYTF
ncbi:MAG: TorF family putative porin [Burkholderiaceae bacterium]